MGVAAKPIRTEADHRAALDRVDALMNAPAGSPEADELEVLSLLIADFEERAFPIDPPSPLDAIRFRLEQLDLQASALVPAVGSDQAAEYLLQGRLPLTLDICRALHRDLGIPAELLLRGDGD